MSSGILPAHRALFVPGLGEPAAQPVSAAPRYPVPRSRTEAAVQVADALLLARSAASALVARNVPDRARDGWSQADQMRVERAHDRLDAALDHYQTLSEGEA